MVDNFNEYILKPYWIDLNELKSISGLFLDFYTFENFELTKEKIDLNVLRRYYCHNKQQALDLIDELVLRGFSFFSVKQSSALPNVLLNEPISYLSAQLNDDSYKTINFDTLGLGNIIHRFLIQSNSFFNGIPIQSFFYLNHSVNLELLQIEFTTNGFQIMEAGHKTEIIATEKADCCLGRLLIENVFSEGIFNNFRRYCAENNIYYLSNLKEFDFNTLTSLGGFGKTRIEKITERYNNPIENISIKNIVPDNTEIPVECANIKIQQAFSESKFNLFRNYCIKNHIVVISDLQNFDFDNLLQVEGLGLGKIESIKNKFLKILSDNDMNAFNKAENTMLAQEFDIHKDFEKVPVNVAFEDVVADFLESIGVNYIRDFNSFNSKQLYNISGMGIKHIEELVNQIRSFDQSLDEFIKNKFDSLLKFEGYDIYRSRVLKKMTLEQMSQQYNITREGVRQKEVKAELKIGRMLAIVDSALYENGLLDSDSVLDFDDFENLLGSYENALIAKDYIKNNQLTHISYSNKLDKFLIDVDVKIVDAKLEDILTKMGETFNFYDEMENIEERLQKTGIGFVDVFYFEDYIRNCGYIKYNYFYSKHKLTDEYICGFVLENYFSDGIRHNDENIKKLRDLVISNFGITEYIKKNDRNIWTKIERNPEAILWGSSVRIHINNVVISDSLIISIKDFIDSSFETSNSISVDFIFNELKQDIYNESNIKDKFALYGIITYYFKDRYSYKKLMIKKIEVGTSNTQEILEKILIDNGGKLSISSIKSKLKWTDIMINAAINFNNNILSWENGNFLIHASALNLTSEFKQQLLEKIKDSFEDGYTNAYMILKNAKILFIKNGLIDAADSVSVFSLAKYLYSNVFFFSRRPHILLSQPGHQFTSKQLLLQMFESKPIINYGEMMHTITDKYKLSELTAGNIIIKTREELFQINMDQYCLPRDVELSEDDIEKVILETEKRLEDKDYIVLTEYDNSDLCSRCMNIRNEKVYWNRFIIKSVLERHLGEKYCTFMRKRGDWRFDNSIVVRTTSQFTTVEDVIVYILKNEFTDKDKMLIPNIENFLMQKGIIYKKIPEEFFKLDSVNIDEFGRVNIVR